MRPDDLADGDWSRSLRRRRYRPRLRAASLKMEVETVKLDTLPPIPVKITMNVGNPELAFEFQRCRTTASGWRGSSSLSTTMIGVHPKAVLDYPDLDADLKQAVESVAAWLRRARVHSSRRNWPKASRRSPRRSGRSP